MLLTDIGVNWFTYKHKSNQHLLKRPRTSKEEHKKEDNIKNLQKSHQHWNDQKSKSIGIILSGLFPEFITQIKPFVNIPKSFI